MREHEHAEGNEHEEVSEYEEESEHEHEGERADEDDNIGHDGGVPAKARDRGGNGLVKVRGYEEERRVVRDKGIRICEVAKARELDNGSHWREGVKVDGRRTRAREEGTENGGDIGIQMSVLVLHDRTPEGYDRPGRTTGHRTRVLAA